MSVCRPWTRALTRGSRFKGGYRLEVPSVGVKNARDFEIFWRREVCQHQDRSKRTWDFAAGSRRTFKSICKYGSCVVTITRFGADSDRSSMLRILLRSLSEEEEENVSSFGMESRTNSAPLSIDDTLLLMLFIEDILVMVTVCGVVISFPLDLF